MGLLDDDRMYGGQDETFSKQGLQQIKNVATWTRIIAICGFSIIGLLLLLAIFLMTKMAGTPASMMIAPVLMVVLIAGGLGGWLLFLLLQYGKQSKSFVDSGNPRDYEAATGTRKIYWLVVGILSILGALMSLVSTFTLLGGGRF